MSKYTIFFLYMSGFVAIYGDDEEDEFFEEEPTEERFDDVMDEDIEEEKVVRDSFARRWFVSWGFSVVGGGIRMVWNITWNASKSDFTYKKFKRR